MKLSKIDHLIQDIQWTAAQKYGGHCTHYPVSIIAHGPLQYTVEMPVQGLSTRLGGHNSPEQALTNLLTFIKEDQP